jgi:hypothetical protein
MTGEARDLIAGERKGIGCRICRFVADRVVALPVVFVASETARRRIGIRGKELAARLRPVYAVAGAANTMSAPSLRDR